MRRTPTAASTSCARTFTVLALCAGAAAAQPAVPSSAVAEVSEAPALPTPQRTVDVVVVGEGIPVREIERTLGPALRSAYRLRFISADTFAPPDLFHKRTESNTDITMWIDTSDPSVARLYFVNGQATRYLARSLELSGSMDEMDRETIAQAVEWSLSALIEGTAGLTRAQAESLLQPHRQPPSPETPPSPPPPSTAVREWRRIPRGILPEATLFYRVASHSKELPVAHGPGLRVGGDWVTPSLQLGLAASAQAQYPQRVVTSELALDLQTLALRFDGRLLSTALARGNAIGVCLGVGFDSTWRRVETYSDRYTPDERGRGIVPLVNGMLVWQIRAESSVRLELGVGGELDLASVSYDVVRENTVAPLVSRWQARPTATVGLSLF